MARLSKVYVAFFHDKGKRSFATEKIAARNYEAAMEVAETWAISKYHGRVKEIKIEKSKGEILLGDD